MTVPAPRHGSSPHLPDVGTATLDTTSGKGSEMRSEPVAVNAAIMAVISGVLSLLVAFGFDLTEDQVVAILGVANPLLMLIGAIVTRSIVWSPASVEKFLVEDEKPAE